MRLGPLLLIAMATNSLSMPRERDDESGQYTETYPTEDVLAAIREAGGMASTRDVTDALGSSYETAYQKLRALEDAGDVESRKVANARLWMVGDDE